MSMQDIFILGAGGFAKEVCFLIDDINNHQPSFEVKGFVDARVDQRELMIGNRRIAVIREDDFLKGSTNAMNVALGVGDPKLLASFHDKFSRFRLPNLIHPGFVGHRDSILFGVGNIITAGCIFTVSIKVGSMNLFNLNSTVGHDTTIGSFNVFNPGVNLSGGVTIGNGNLVGTNATILQYITMGSRSVLGANALLTKDLGDDATAVGVPAKPISRK